VIDHLVSRANIERKLFMKKFDFPSFWNEDHEKNFNMLKLCMQDVKNPRCLEIGGLEGRTSLWLIENIVQPLSGSLTIVEPDIKLNLIHNLSNSRQWVNVEEGKSFNVLNRYIVNYHTFDFIYIDGDHNAKGVLEDLVLSWRILNNNGFLLFDDYEMQAQDPWFYIMHKEFKKPRINFIHPHVAIDAFLSMYRGLYEIIAFNYQLMVRKIGDIDGDNNLMHGDDTQNEMWIKRH